MVFFLGYNGLMQLLLLLIGLHLLDSLYHQSCLEGDDDKCISFCMYAYMI